MAEIDYNSLSKDELKNILDEKGINYNQTDTKKKLIELLG